MAFFTGKSVRVPLLPKLICSIVAAASFREGDVCQWIKSLQDCGGRNIHDPAVLPVSTDGIYINLLTRRTASLLAKLMHS